MKGLLIQFLCVFIVGRVVVAQLPGICGSQAKGALCPDKQCCSQYGFCGTTKEFCLTSLRCQSRCINDGPPPKKPGDIPNINESKLFKPPAGTFNSKKLVGYFSNWAQYRGFDPSTPACTGGEYAFLPENINPHLYTHINYAFVFMAENNSVVPHEHNDEELSLRMNKWIHRINPSCTTSISIGGWSMNDGPSKYTGGVDYTPFFSKMADTAASRATFIQSAIEFARRLEFDGIDIDWEFIGDSTRGGKPADRENFNALMREMRAAMKADAASSGKKELMITMAAPAGPDNFKNIDAKTISDYVDWINIMTYDFYGNWENTVENHAPIADTRIPKWSFTSAIDQYLGAGVPPAKLMAGLPLYGRVWTLSDLSNTSPGAPGTAGTAGRCTAEHGYMSYFEIKEVADAQEGRGVSFEPQDGYYMVFDNQWVGYDDEFSFSAKVGIINDRGLGGAMLWAVDLDTSDAALTRKLLEFYRACPKDDVWPTTSTDQVAIIDCLNSSNKPGNTQQRHCNADGTWGTVDSKSCSSFAMASLAAQQCIG